MYKYIYIYINIYIYMHIYSSSSSSSSSICCGTDNYGHSGSWGDNTNYCIYFFMYFFSLGKLLITNIGMVFASIFLFVGLIISIMTKCKQFSENGYKVIAGILAGVVILGGMVFIYLIIL